MKKQWYFFIGILILALIIGIIRVETGGNYYKYTSEEVYKLTLNSEIFIDSATVLNSDGFLLIFQLDTNSEMEFSAKDNLHTVIVAPSQLLDSDSKKLYKTHEGSIVLKSNSALKSANAWVLLTRLGYSNVKIWGDSEDEIFKYSFQPDSIVGLK